MNEQAQVSLLLAGCGVLATLTFAPWIVTLLYSNDFEAGTDVLRWVTLGMAMRVITWPVGYILVAKGEKALFVAADLAWAIVNVGLTWLCVPLFGLAGAGIAFLGSYAVHLLVVYSIARRIAGYRWSTTNLRKGALFARPSPSCSWVSRPEPARGDDAGRRRDGGERPLLGACAAQRWLPQISFRSGCRGYCEPRRMDYEFRPEA